MTPEQVRHRRRTGVWVRFAGAAFRQRDRAPEPWTDAYAVALTWPDGVACLGAAARFHHLPAPAPAPVQANVPHSRRAQLNMRPMRYALDPTDVIRFDDLAVTTLNRTVVDCIGLLPRRAAEELLVWVLTRRILSHDDLCTLIAARPRLVGNHQRHGLLAMTAGGAMSVAEGRLHVILRRAGITGWVTDEPIHDRRGLIGSADVVFPAELLVIEVDGMAYHGAARFQSDRSRQNRLVTAGYTVLRFTWADLVDRPAMVADQIEAALRRARRARSG